MTKTMTIIEAFEQVLNNSNFQAGAKEKNTKGSYYRQLRSRYNRGILKTSAMVDIILEFGYKINVRK